MHCFSRLQFYRSGGGCARWRHLVQRGQRAVRIVPVAPSLGLLVIPPRSASSARRSGAPDSTRGETEVHFYARVRYPATSSIFPAFLGISFPVLNTMADRPQSRSLRSLCSAPGAPDGGVAVHVDVLLVLRGEHPRLLGLLGVLDLRKRGERVAVIRTPLDRYTDSVKNKLKQPKLGQPHL